MSWRTTFDNGKRRISRRLQIGKRVVNYENGLTRPAWRRSRTQRRNLSGSTSGAGL
ncbi:hypothetical protein KQ302_01580 [Synechococcus sp. CS-602]|uniref:hypothetical protein n=1 Tax=Synechococcaceae TaxID=1890426 RepID=UPI000AD5AE16|nr:MULTISPECIES: hypothetical protein [Synechococcaceae]MCT4365671.1 hypothetical protein [Candidatus Regnicoccus frigidus MAG-AL1]MCT0200928.1 hypothetical protein [Synechococcus sp. CS-603]MCT0203811.1 hypothetical protein [Synechococcus sp. CS-602]MCT0246339.1 hypothetical protein [Synechococcus sp. CS-601]MCT4368352.1 hypothetical protein [Candidatus Regnicoccus frigidus MAG-AL2]